MRFVKLKVSGDNAKIIHAMFKPKLGNIDKFNIRKRATVEIVIYDEFSIGRD
jgi:hypothetical protein